MEGLIVHDDNDPEAPLIEGKSVLREWPGARLVTTHGLGHTRLLRDPDVVREVTTFIVSPEPTQRRQMQEKY
jgi:pimeloyl-ACP methyl ester carboxylesterase